MLLHFRCTWVTPLQEICLSTTSLTAVRCRTCTFGRRAWQWTNSTGIASIHGKIFASTDLSESCEFGVGYYATAKAPHEFSCVFDILQNNYHRTAAQHNEGDAAYCIPLVVRIDSTPSLPLTNPTARPGRILETMDRLGFPFDAKKHDVWLVDAMRTGAAGCKGQLEAAYLMAAEQGQCEIVESLLAKGVDVDALATKSIAKSALRKAATAGQANIIRLLLSNQASVSNGDLHLAAHMGHADCVVELVKARSFSFDTQRWALDAASKRGSAQVVLQLVWARASLTKMDEYYRNRSNDGSVLGQYFCKGNNNDIVKVLLDAGADASRAATYLRNRQQDAKADLLESIAAGCSSTRTQWATRPPTLLESPKACGPEKTAFIQAPRSSVMLL
eukprot:gnl/TRDRNA2_/TRDRNA2_168788_c1_seq3.p1 gnl/TRDRNA2_/TRDRNA2_168788_c1~~gnl/TRDRNA2_/TRDRNA2_168788_c1_seq3.p1  ORF type:complete len:389 (+),score=53.06 gnl/TRDRNA2_/TRDRNA2_168788_c1_seq3:229-1395(+)